MKRRIFFLLIAILGISINFCISAQKKDFSYNFYGFVRGDLYLDSRQNTEPVDGLFYLYPSDIQPDANGKDLNDTPSSGFYTFTTRLGMDITGPNIGTAKSSAKIETDFGGTSGLFFVLRIRQVYVKFDWDKGSSLVLGQTWHPLSGEVMPQVQSLSTGAPFQPFNRSPQIQYQWKRNGLQLKAAALYQLIYKSPGPNGKSEDYLKDGILPEFAISVDYTLNQVLFGVGAEMLSLKPRRQSEMNGAVYKVDERVTSFTCEAHAKYNSPKLFVAGKTLLASNMNHAALMGGYGVSHIDKVTGEQEYTPSRHSVTWINAVYGSRWKGGFFAGYSKNLGTGKALVSTDKIYGSDANIDQLLTLSAQGIYQLPHWRLGVEYQASTAWYGDIDLANGKVNNTHDVTNHRVLGVFIYSF